MNFFIEAPESMYRIAAKSLLELELVQKDCAPVGNPSDNYVSATEPLKPESFAKYRWDMYFGLSMI